MQDDFKHIITYDQEYFVELLGSGVTSPPSDQEVLIPGSVVGFFSSGELFCGM